MTKKVLFYVQHLLGIGHLKRAVTLSRAMTAKGMEITLVSGGEFVPVVDAAGITFVQLPAIKAADRTFSGLVGSDGTEIRSDLKEARKNRLLSVFAELRPDAVVIELYPFGRRQLEFELLPLLEAALSLKPKPLVISSVRDILVKKNRPERDQEMVETAQRYFDKILVHGDPDLIPFDTTFPPAAEIAQMISYTGYVVDHGQIASVLAKDGADEVIVSSGSGAVGEALLRTAQLVREKTYLAGHTWRLLAGYAMAEDVFLSIRDDAGPGVIVERARSDFVTLLKNSKLSISQGGYNTVMEVLATGAVGVVIPYAGGNETEQTMRARLLEEKGLLLQMPEDQLNAKNLTDLVNATEGKLPVLPPSVNQDGARESSRLMVKWLEL
ncbi:MAG: glycosyltransferase [Rhodospirillales bacterium]|nr:glycosyltransferase [Rhodospirillales bacterium]